MAHTKSGGSTKNLKDSKPKYLGVKLYGGQIAKPGSVIIRQRGNKFYPGQNVAQGKDHTLFSKINGRVQFRQKREEDFTGKKIKNCFVEVIPI